jgi:two-component system, NarL family, sensor histidine kinase UhpB
MTDADAHQLTILLVEDDPTDTRLLVSLLDHADLCEYRLRTVGTAADAERALVDDPFDVVLLDLSLPDCDGLVSVERVMAVAPTTPIVVLTGRDDYELGLRSIEAGAQDFLVKGELKGNTILRCAQWSVARAAAGAAASPTDQRWTILDRTVAGVAVVDHELKVVTANPAFVDLTGRAEEHLRSLPLTELVETDDIVGFVLDLRATLRDEAPTRLMDARLRARHGELPARFNVARITPTGDDAPSLLLVVTPVE